MVANMVAKSFWVHGLENIACVDLRQNAMSLEQLLEGLKLSDRASRALFGCFWSGLDDEEEPGGLRKGQHVVFRGK